MLERSEGKPQEGHEPQHPTAHNSVAGAARTDVTHNQQQHAPKQAYTNASSPSFGMRTNWPRTRGRWSASALRVW